MGSTFWISVAIVKCKVGYWISDRVEWYGLVVVDGMVWFLFGCCCGSGLDDVREDRRESTLYRHYLQYKPQTW